MKRHTYLIAPAALVFSVFATLPTKAETASCQHGTTLLQNDAQVWLSLYNQNARLHKNVTHIRTEINDVIVMNDQIGEANKTTNKIHKILNLIAPLFELAPSLQSGLEKAARAAEISHKDVLNPVYDVTNGLVTKAKLHEIENELDTQVLPKIATFEKGSSDAHLKAVTLTRDFIEACHIADTIKQATCISSGEKAIDDVYAAFRVPVQTVNTVVVDTANAINVLNKIMEAELSVSMRPIIAIKNPMDDVAHAIHELDKAIHKLEHEMKKHIHIHVGPVKVRFTIKHLLKKWEKEVKKLEHFMHVDKIKAEMRRAVETALHRVVHDIEKEIHHLEHSVKIDGFNLSDLDLANIKLRTGLDFKDIDFGLGTYDIAIKGMSLGLHGLKTCK